jgi:hypothetical protein
LPAKRAQDRFRVLLEQPQKEVVLAGDGYPQVRDRFWREVFRRQHSPFDQWHRLTSRLARNELDERMMRAAASVSGLTQALRPAKTMS